MGMVARALGAGDTCHRFRAAGSLMREVWPSTPSRAGTRVDGPVGMQAEAQPATGAGPLMRRRLRQNVVQAEVGTSAGAKKGWEQRKAAGLRSLGQTLFGPKPDTGGKKMRWVPIKVKPSEPRQWKRQYQVETEDTGPHDDRVPVASFADDLQRKVALRRVMYDEQGRTVEPTDRGAQYTKDEVNYRYAADPQRSCGTCKNFVQPGACAIVAGMIRPVDVCDKWEAKTAPVAAAMNGMAPDNPTGSFADSEGQMDGYNGLYDDLYDGGADMGLDDGTGVDDCEDWERDDQGRCPHDPEYMGGEGTDYGYGMATDEEEEEGRKVHFSGPHGEGDAVVDDQDSAHGGHGHGIRGMSDIPVVRAELIGPEGPYAHDDDGLEVTPPGFEPVVKALKKRPGVENPWAVAWAMKGKGVQPAGKSSEVLPTRRGGHSVQAELVRREQMPATSPGGSSYSGPAAGAGGGAMSAPTGPSAGAGGGAMSAPSTVMSREHHRSD